MKSFFGKLKNGILKISSDKRLFWLSYAFYFFGLVFLDYTFRFFYKHIVDIRLIDINTAIFTVCWAALLTSISALLPRLIRRIFMSLTGLFYTVLVLVHAGMYSVFGQFFSFSSLSFAGDGAAFFSWDYINIRKLLILCIIFSLLCFIAAVIITPRYPKGKLRVAIRIISAVILVGSIGAIILNHSTFKVKGDALAWDTDISASSKATVYTNFKDLNQCMYYTGIYQYTFRDVSITLGFDGNTLDSKELEEYFDKRSEEISGDNEMTGKFKDKNLIMVMLESIDTWMLRPEYMPNLYALQQSSVNFQKHYTPAYLYAATFNTEIISMTGNIPSANNLPSSAYVENDFSLSLPSLFKAKGYNVNSYHTSSPTIYNRGAIHNNLGFTKYHAYTDMKMNDYQLDSQMLNGYNLMTFDDKFYDFIITYSGHGPHTDEMGNISAPHLEKAKQAIKATGVTSSNSDTMSQYTYSIAHAMETDKFIGGLIERLENDGLLDDTVLFFYTDHYGKYLTDTDFIKQLKGVTAENAEDLYNTPCFLYSEDLTPQVITKYTSTVDIAPTIANLFDLDVDRKYYIGDDVFGDKGGVVMMSDYSWFDSDTTMLESKTGSTKEIKSQNTIVYNKINMSMNTYLTDFFRTIKE